MAGTGNGKDFVKDYYALLEVSVKATSQDIKNAWREQLQVWHPDRFTHNSKLYAKAEAKTKEINEAYEVLRDDDKRCAYDEARRGEQEFQEDKKDYSNAALMADLIMPFVLEMQSLERAAYAYMAEGKYTPDDLIQTAKISKQERLYLPCYLFHGSYVARWTASFGFNRTEHYTEYQSQYNLNTRRYNRVPVSRARTVTDWRPQSGTASGSFAVMTYAGSTLDASLLPLVEKRDGRETIINLDPSAIQGFEIESFALSERDAYTMKADPAITKAIDASVRQYAQGDRQRDWHWKADIERQSKKVLMPIGHTTFEYRDKQYNVWVDGANPERRLGDSLPVDKKRILAVIWGFIPAVISLLSVVLSYAIFQEKANAGVAMSIPSGCLIFGLLRWKNIIDYSQTVRRLLLQERVTTEKLELPRRPFFANTLRDATLLPILSVVLSMCILFPPWFANEDIKEKVTSYFQQWGITQPTISQPRTAEQAIEDERERLWREK